MAKRGRITKLNADTAAAYCAHLSAGLGRRRAAGMVGIHPATVYRWLALARSARGEPIYANFATEIARAEAEFLSKTLATVVQAAKPRQVRVTRTITRADGSVITETTEREVCDWHAAKWLLEVKDRASFGPERHEMTVLRKELAELKQRLDDRSNSS